MVNSARADRKSYAQICPMATALDVIGDRWTPLILRELLGGPARFNELEDGLPGIAKNLLTSRLRRLEADGIVRRVTMHGAPLYALTDHGAAIRPTLEELGFWGASLQRIAPAEHDRSIRAIAMALQSVLVRAGDALPDDRCLVELEVGGEYVEIVLGPRPTAIARPCSDADARVTVPTAMLSELLLGGDFESERFVCTAGSEQARDMLLNALSAARPTV